ncbi:hypothetical protein, partial [Micromonospora coerulea]|uniref:hypothetical protein n=1 Tax=Micromonospora coerulea TaxID=47856 RepID=UPI001F403C83
MRGGVVDQPPRCGPGKRVVEMPDPGAHRRVLGLQPGQLARQCRIRVAGAAVAQPGQMVGFGV